MEHHLVATGRDFHANYRKTERNAPSGQVFVDLGMLEVGVSDGLTLLVFPHDSLLPDDRIIDVRILTSKDSVSLS